MFKKLAILIVLLVFSAGPLHAAEFYVGPKLGWMDPDVSGLDAAFNMGALLGVEVVNNDIRYGAELEATGTVSDGDAPFGGDWDVTTYAIYGVFKYGATAYFKAKVGYLYEDVSVSIAGFSASGDDSGLSGGAGVGYRFNDLVSLEGEFTVIEQDIFFYSLGVNFHF